jgi:hypothetical protein
MENAEVKVLIEAKLAEATTSNRVSAFKAMKAAEVAECRYRQSRQPQQLLRAAVAAKSSSF